MTVLLKPVRWPPKAALEGRHFAAQALTAWFISRRSTAPACARVR